MNRLNVVDETILKLKLKEYYDKYLKPHSIKQNKECWILNDFINEWYNSLLLYPLLPAEHQIIRIGHELAEDKINSETIKSINGLRNYLQDKLSHTCPQEKPSTGSKWYQPITF